MFPGYLYAYKFYQTPTTRHWRQLSISTPKKGCQLSSVWQDSKLSMILLSSLSLFFRPILLLWPLQSIRPALLYKLNKKYEVPSVRKPPPADIATQAVLAKIADDPSQGRGVGTIGVLLNNDGIPLPRFVWVMSPPLTCHSETAHWFIATLFGIY